MEISKTENDVIDKLIDYVLLNAYSLNAFGLYNGKAGLALSLFEVAAMRQNERLADHAVELMKESLYFVNGDVGFENGLSGIAFMLLYVDRYHQYISADFDSLFGKGRKRIKSGLSEIVKHDEYCFREIEILSYLSVLGEKRDEEENTLFKALLSGIFSRFEILLKNIKSLENKKTKCVICNQFGKLLHILSVFRVYFSKHLYDEKRLFSLCRKFCEFYAESVFAGNYELGYFLRLYGENRKNPFISEMACRMKDNGLNSIYPAALSLRQKIDLMFLLEKDVSVCHSLIDTLYRSIWQTKGKSTEQSIRSNINPEALTCGFGEGVSRLLTYWVYRTSIASGCNVTRFDTLFM